MKTKYNLEKQEALVEILWDFAHGLETSDHNVTRVKKDGSKTTANLKALDKALTEILKTFGLSEVEVQ